MYLENDILFILIYLILYFLAQFYSYKVPLYPVALSTSSGTVNNVNSFINNMITGVALPFSGPVAVTLTGGK